MSNFGKGFTRGIKPFIGSTADLLSRLLIYKGYEEQERLKEIDFKTQQGIEKGNQERYLQTALDYQGKSNLPKNPDFLAKLFLGMSPDTRGVYGALDEMRTPKKAETWSVDGNLYPSKQIDNKLFPDIENPIYKKPEAPLKTSKIIKARDYKQSDSSYPFKDYPSDYRVELSLDGENITNVGQPYTWTKEKDDGSGVELNKNVTKTLNKYLETLKGKKAQLETLRKGLPIKGKNAFGITWEILPTGADDFEQTVKGHQTEYQSYIQNNRSIESTDLWNSLDTQTKQGNPQNIEPSKWNSIFKAWESGNLDDATYQELYHSFASKYGYDPLIRFGSGR